MDANLIEWCIRAPLYFGYYEYGNYYRSEICDICGTTGYRFTRAYTLYVRHAEEIIRRAIALFTVSAEREALGLPLMGIL